MRSKPLTLKEIVFSVKNKLNAWGKLDKGESLKNCQDVGDTVMKDREKKRFKTCKDSVLRLFHNSP